jgi:hypothetical protein
MNPQVGAQFGRRKADLWGTWNAGQRPGQVKSIHASNYLRVIGDKAEPGMAGSAS